MTTLTSWSCTANAEQYLERAYRTALAMSTINAKVLGWSAYETGFYNKLVIPQLIDELAAAGTTEDSTGFESTQAIARYALDHPECP